MSVDTKLSRRNMPNFTDMFMGKLLKSGEYYGVMNNFRKLKTDEDRIVFSFNFMSKNNLFLHFFARTKDAELSEAFREDGNKIFVRCNSDITLCRSALALYTKSIIFAPYPSKELVFAYANRSAVLFELGLYSECVRDIDRALVLSYYPDDRKGKLFLRKTQCLIILQDQTVRNMIKETEYWINKMTLGDNKKKLQAKLDGLCQKIGQDVPCDLLKVKEQESESPLPIIKSCNNEIPCASDAIELRYDEYIGRHIVATRDIHAGEVLVVEKAYSLLLSFDNITTHCSNCLKVCWAPVACTHCIYSLYCSEQCRDDEWKKYHYIECGLFSIFLDHNLYNTYMISLRLAVLAIKEAGSVKKLRSMLENTDKSDPRTMGFSQDGKFHSDKYISLHSLSTHSRERSCLDLFQRSLNTCFILNLLAQYNKYEKLFDTSDDSRFLITNDNIVFLGGLILKHQQIIMTNVHSFCEEREMNSATRGLAAMPFCSLFNHSCSSNMIRVSKCQHTVLYALYPIRKNEQLFDNYGYHFALTPKISRRRSLLENYYFGCNCTPCEENWPLFPDFQSFETLVEAPNDKDIIRSALKKYNSYFDLAEKGDVFNKPFMIEDLIMMIRVLYDYVPIFCKEMSNVVETLKRVYCLHGNVFTLPGTCKRDN